MTLPVFYDNLWIENRVGIKRDRIRKICWHKEWEKGGTVDQTSSAYSFFLRYRYDETVSKAIEGGELPVVVCFMDAGETMITEKGSMSWMSPNMKMETTSNGGVGKALGRMFAGEAIFQNRYTAEGGPGMIAFASSFPGQIRPWEIAPGKEIVVQKAGFLAAQESVELSIFFQKKLGSGLFGGEGFIMQKISGHGLAFLEFDGSVIEYVLQPGQQIVVDTGYLAAMEATCNMEIRTVPGIKNMMFGGEGLFNTVITGPGRVWLQTMPISNVAGAIMKVFPAR